MSINIKEIFKSDLDPNSSNWWAKDKIDKLNFNFGQLSNGGMSGPMGSQGIPGETGIRGDQGVEGSQGPRGTQGFVGTPAISIWKSNIGQNNITLLPNAMQGVEFSAVGLITGKNNQPNSDYDVALPFDGISSTAAVFYGAVDRANFALDNDFEVASGKHTFANNTLNIGDPINQNGNLHINFDLDNTTINLYTSNNDVGDNVATQSAITFQSTLLKIDKSSIFNEEVNINTLKYTLNAANDQVLISTDNDGTVIWKSKYEVFGALPIGSIMSIPFSEFNETNFHLYADNPITDGVDGLLQNVHGRGRLDTAFEGWYLCNGQTWELGGIVSHDVPNLNSYNFTIDSNGLDQDQITNGGDNTPIIIGGASLEIDANYNATSTGYDIDTLNINTTDIQHSWSTLSNTYEQTRMIHLINLGETSLYWKSVPGAVIPTETIQLSIPQDTSQAACDAITQLQYTWTGVGIDWVTGNVSGTQLYFNGALATGNKWYEKDGTARLWTGTTWSTTNICLGITGYPLHYSSDDVRDLNWATPPAGQYINYIIDATVLKFATTIKNLNGTFAAAGWYRATDSAQTAWYRVYWDGSQIQHRTASNYIHYAGKLTPYALTGPNACFSTESDIDVYYHSVNAMAYNSNILFNLHANSNTLVVNKNWIANTSNDIGKYNLEYIANQNRPGASVPWAQLVEMLPGSTVFASITTNSKLTNYNTCI